MKKANQQSANNTSLIARGMEFHGDLHFSGILEIEGLIVGNIIAHDDAVAEVRIREAGVVKGLVRAPVVIVNGVVEGDRRDAGDHGARRPRSAGDPDALERRLVAGAADAATAPLLEHEAGPEVGAEMVGCGDGLPRRAQQGTHHGHGRNPAQMCDRPSWHRGGTLRGPDLATLTGFP